MCVKYWLVGMQIKNKYVVPSSKKSLNSIDQTNLYYLAVFWRLAVYGLFSATKF
jgi:hypothetical protein